MIHREFPDNKKAVAVCFSLYRQAKKKAAKGKDEDQSGENWEEAPIASWDDTASDIEKTGTIKTEYETRFILPADIPKTINFIDPTDQK